MARCAANRWVLPLTLVLLAMGCSVVKPPPSPYAAQYSKAKLVSDLPPAELVAAHGEVVLLERPIAEVRQAVMSIVHQYEGVIAFEELSGGGVALTTIHGVRVPFKVQGARASNPAMTVDKFLDAWLAITVTPTRGDHSRVQAAWVDPTTMEPAPTPEVPSPESVESAEPAQAPIRDWNTTALLKERKRLKHAVRDAEETQTQWGITPSLAINDFFFHLSTLLEGPEQWTRKFRQAPPPGSVSLAPSLPRDYSEYRQVEHEIGNWTSAKLRRDHVVVHDTMVSAALRETLSTLRDDGESVHCYVLASEELNAFALPNGEVFVTSTLLDMLETRDQLAAVLAHELDHVAHHDTTERLIQLAGARTRQEIAYWVAVLGAPMVGPAASTAAQASSHAVMHGIRLGLELGTYLVNHEIITGHSEGAELRADANSLRYLAEAGYEPRAMLDVLELLRVQEGLAEANEHAVTSGLINAAPGLDERITKVGALLDE